MATHKKYLTATAALALVFVSCKTQPIRTDQAESGVEWLSWTASERNNYVYGYLDGFLRARILACGAADGLFEVGQPHRLGDELHPSEVPSGRCLASVDSYSRFRTASSPAIDLRIYVNPISQFYKSHPQYRGVPFPFLMESLSDRKSSTAEQLYQLALAGKLRAVR